MTSAITLPTYQYTPVLVERLPLQRSDTTELAFNADGVDAGLRGDSVAISKEARAKLEEEPIVTSPWETDYGYTNGTSILNNGNLQTVTIKGNHLTIQEFYGNDIVREESAEITLSGLTRDITLYDERGNIASTMQSSLQNGLGTGVDATFATLTRSTQWFENGVLVRDMQDSMGLEAKYDDLADLDPDLLPKADNMEVLKKYMSSNDAAANYHATITEFEDGKLSRQATISRGLHSLSISNRGERAIGNLRGRSSWECGGDNSLSISMTSFDSLGKVSFEADYTDKTDIGVERKQHLSMTTYKDGKMTSRSEGDMVNKKAPVTEEHNQPQLLNALGIRQEEFASSTPLTAMDMLTRRFQESSTQPDYFLSPALDEANDNGHPLISGESKRKRPYTVQWHNETYVDGELVARQLDTEQATENPLASRDPFAPGKGLTEDDNPLVLLRSSHKLEFFKNGSSSLNMHSEMHEVVNIYDRDVAMVDTHVKVGSGVKLPSNDSRTLWRGRLDTVDKDAHAASQGFAKNLGQYLAAVHGMISEQQAQGDQASGLRLSG